MRGTDPTVTSKDSLILSQKFLLNGLTLFIVPNRLNLLQSSSDTSVDPFSTTSTLGLLSFTLTSPFFCVCTLYVTFMYIMFNRWQTYTPHSVSSLLRLLQNNVFYICFWSTPWRPRLLSLPNYIYNLSTWKSSTRGSGDQWGYQR